MIEYLRFDHGEKFKEKVTEETQKLTLATKSCRLRLTIRMTTQFAKLKS